jgi:hypothetical protein
VGWVTESVAQIRQSSSPPVLAGFYIVDFLSYCASLSHGIANMTVDREDERRHYVRRLAVSIAAFVQHAVLPEPNADEAIRNALPRWRVSEELRRFLFESTPELGANVAEEIWDWSLASAELRWLALLVDGPWARRHS